ncbi:hypothetical protein ACFX11_026664 [Malus domestica]
MLIRQCVYNNVKREEIQKMFPVSFSENDGEMHSRISTQCQVLRSTDQLTAVVDVGEGDAMLEVGLGTGSLTNVLINAGAFVLAIKKDPYMATHVSERFAETDWLKVLKEDFVKCRIHSRVVVVGMYRAIGLTPMTFRDSIFPFFN